MKTADAPLLNRISDTPFQPIFILGFHRSGTTLLYDLLRRTEAFNILSVYHILRYDELLRNHLEGRTEEVKRALSEQFERLGITDRKIDRVEITPDTPEEYGWLLKWLPRLNRPNLARFTEMCRKVQCISESGRPLLLKNPWDYDRNFLNLARFFPEARFIFIHRRPADVVSSQVKALRSSFAEKNEYGALLSRRYELMFKRRVGLHLMRFINSDVWDIGARIMCRHFARSSNYYLDHVDRLDTTHYRELRYEDLCADPDGAVSDIMAFLGLASSSEQEFSSLIAQRPSRVLPDVERQIARIAPRLQRYNQRYGYEA